MPHPDIAWATLSGFKMERVIWLGSEPRDYWGDSPEAHQYHERHEVLFHHQGPEQRPPKVDADHARVAEWAAELLADWKAAMRAVPIHGASLQATTWWKT
jgi:hypothetical protein